MKLRYYIAIAAYCSFLFWLSHQSSPIEVEIRFPGEDKVAHLVLYGVLGALVSIGLHRAPRRYPDWVMAYGPVLFAVLYGVSDEFHQYFVPLRTPSLLDLVADGVGATLAHMACRWYFRWRSARGTAAVHET